MHKRFMYWVVMALTVTLIGSGGQIQAASDSEIVGLNLTQTVASSLPLKVRTDALTDAEAAQILLNVDAAVISLAKSYYEQFLVQYQPVDASTWMHLVRIAYSQIREQGHVLHAVKTHGRLAAAVTVGGEILSTFILPPIFLWMHHPMAAGISAGVPWGVVGGSIVGAIEMLLARARLAREVGVPSLKALDQLRRELVGYDLKHHVTTGVIQALYRGYPRELYFEIVKKAGERLGPRPPVVTIRELEDIVGGLTFTGPAFLKSIIEFKPNSVLYAMKLITFIRADDRLATQLIEKILVSGQTGVSRDFSMEQRNFLFKFKALSDQLNRTISEIEHEISGLKTRVLYREITVSQMWNRRVELANLKGQLEYLRNSAVRAEYLYLAALQASTREERIRLMPYAESQYLSPIVNEFVRLKAESSPTFTSGQAGSQLGKLSCGMILGI